MEKWLRKDIEASEKLYKELVELDSQKPAVEEEKKKLDPGIRAKYREWVLERAVGNFEVAASADRERERLLSQKFSIGDLHYRKRDKITAQVREVNQKYIIVCISDLNKLVHQILGQRRFEIKERATSGDKGLPFYVIAHNWVSIGNLVEVLMATMDKIRDSGLSPLSEIRRIYEDAVKNIPDDFPLTDEAQGGELMLSRFREAMGEGHIEVVDDNFIRMTLDQGKALVDVSKFQVGIQSLKKFFQGRT